LKGFSTTQKANKQMEEAHGLLHYILQRVERHPLNEL